MPELPVSETSNPLSIALIAPNAGRRHLLVTALAGSQVTITREYSAYPSQSDLAEIAALKCGAVIVDLDDDAENALRSVQMLCDGNASMTVMAFSNSSDAALMRRSMEAGAREFLTEPLRADVVNEALTRALSRISSREKALGKVIVFLPSKGGVGTTTLALNFALALKTESGASVVLVDLDYELGEIALGLGMTPHFSVIDALQNPTRLDKAFLSTILLRHNSGLAVLASAEEYSMFHAEPEGARKLFQILRSEFAYVIVDGGTCHSYIQETLFEIADTTYLITEMTFPAIRNAHRIIAFLSKRDGGRGLEIIVNRSASRHMDIDEDAAMKALARPINWRVPNCYAAAREAQDTGVPLAMSDNPVSRVLLQMADATCGKRPRAEKKKSVFSFLGLNTQTAKAGA